MPDATQNIKRVVEVQEAEEANAYLELGWILLGVHQHSHLKAGKARAYTVYVLGHTAQEPPELAAREDFDFDFDTNSLR